MEIGRTSSLVMHAKFLRRTLQCVQCVQCYKLHTRGDEYADENTKHCNTACFRIIFVLSDIKHIS